MAWFDEPNLFYKGFDETTPLNQGDIVVAPTSVIRPGAGSTGTVGPTALDESRESTLWQAGADAMPAAPEFASTTLWGLAMVIPHACAMEKEWNERIEDLRHAGVGDDEAMQLATEDTSLDPYITLAPIVSYGTIPEHRRTGVKMNQRLGRFPVCADRAIPESFVDFARMSTVRYDVASRVRRVASISDVTLGHLQHNLVMHFAGRSLAQFAELERAIGQKIAAIAVSNRAKGRLILTMTLESGQQLPLETRDTTGAEHAAASVERPPRA